jgi:hypothetical protein
LSKDELIEEWFDRLTMIMLVHPEPVEGWSGKLTMMVR